MFRMAFCLVYNQFRRKLMPANVKRLLAELKKGLEKLYGNRLKGLILYGSYARGDQREGSDLDILVILNGIALPIYFAIYLWNMKLRSVLCLCAKKTGLQRINLCFEMYV